MPRIPGTKTDVHFGFTNDLPDWRKHPPNDETDSDSEDATPEERAEIERSLGVTMDELFGDDEDSDEDTSE